MLFRSVSALTYYVLIYVVANLSVFTIISSIEEHNNGTVQMDSYNGLYKTNPRLAFLMTLALFSLGGIPPFAGMFSKFFVFMAAVGTHDIHTTLGAWAYGVVFIALVNTVISLYYYLLIVKAMFIKHSDNIYAFVVKILPEKLTQKLERYTDEEQSEKEQDSDWSAFLSRYIRTVALYGVIMAGIGIIGRYWLLPLLETALPSASASKAVTLAVIYLGMALFIRPMLDTRSPQYTVLWMKKRSFRLPLMALSGIRILLIALIAFIPLRNIAGIGSAWLLPVIVAALLGFCGPDPPVRPTGATRG